MRRKAIRTAIWRVFVLAVFWAVAGCSPTPETGTLGPAEQQETVMRSDSPAPLSPGKIPPIDASAPQTLDAATFGLG